MYAAVDIGGTKTLIAAFDADGTLLGSFKFPTPPDYPEFLVSLNEGLQQLPQKEFSAVCAAVPGVIDRAGGIGVTLGNLPWENLPIRDDISSIFKCPVVLENDAKLAGLSEALLIKDKYGKVLYVTISTGIGIGLISQGVIDDAVGDTGGHDMYVEDEGKMVTWEKLTSGKAIVARYGKRASEIDDPEIWEEIAHRISLGMVDLIALFQPEAVVIGGGVGTHFQKFSAFLEAELTQYQSNMLHVPPLLQAQRPEEAVIYGCYELARQAGATAT